MERQAFKDLEPGALYISVRPVESSICSRFNHILICATSTRRYAQAMADNEKHSIAVADVTQLSQMPSVEYPDALSCDC